MLKVPTPRSSTAPGTRCRSLRRRLPRSWPTRSFALWSSGSGSSTPRCPGRPRCCGASCSSRVTGRCPGCGCRRAFAIWPAAAAYGRAPGPSGDRPGLIRPAGAAGYGGHRRARRAGGRRAHSSGRIAAGRAEPDHLPRRRAQHRRRTRPAPDDSRLAGHPAPRPDRTRRPPAWHAHRAAECAGLECRGPDPHRQLKRRVLPGCSSTPNVTGAIPARAGSTVHEVHGGCQAPTSTAATSSPARYWSTSPAPPLPAP